MAKKRDYAPKMNKVGGTWRRADKWLMGNKTVRRGFSYRDLWLQQGNDVSFEDWLKEKGIVLK